MGAGCTKLRVFVRACPSRPQRKETADIRSRANAAIRKYREQAAASEGREKALAAAQEALAAAEAEVRKETGRQDLRRAWMASY